MEDKEKIIIKENFNLNEMSRDMDRFKILSTVFLLATMNFFFWMVVLSNFINRILALVFFSLSLFGTILGTYRIHQKKREINIQLRKCQELLK